MRLIDKNNVLKAVKTLSIELDAETVQRCIETVSNQPTVDAVPVVRCKDCKYYRKDGDCWYELDIAGRIYYQSVINKPNPDDYCSRAKRKEE